MPRNMCSPDIIIGPERDDVYNNWGTTDNWAVKSSTWRLMLRRFKFSPYFCFQTALMQQKQSDSWQPILFIPGRAVRLK